MIMAASGQGDGWIEDIPRPGTEPETNGAPNETETDAAPGGPETDAVPGDTETGAAETEETQTETAESETAVPASDGIPAWGWIAGGGLLLALAAVLALVFFRKKKRAKPVSLPEPERPAAPPAAAAVVQVGNLHHIGAREEQQDSFAISDCSNGAMVQRKGCFAVVADGMGGLTGGGQVSAIVTSSMLRAFESCPSVGEKQIPELLLVMVQGANRDVLRFLGKARGQSGSTVTAVWILGDRLHFLSVGDSRICLIRGGALTILNREHVYGTELDEKAARGEISLEEARSDPQRKSLTSYIGTDPLKKIDRSVHGMTLLPGDKVLLMSDGVFGTLTEQEILRAAQGDAQVMAEGLQGMILAKRRPGQDNFTAVILQCG